MILKGSQRGGARQLAVHLLNDKDNDHVALGDLRGFVSEDLYGAMAETQAVAKGTKCRQPVFSLSLSPPKDADVTRGDLLAAADRAETALGLDGQPRAVVIHEKNGRLHAHVVWSRIDADRMKAINLPFFKTKLNELSRELYLDHGWELPDGHKTNGWKNPLNFTLAEWQQARRTDLDPRELKAMFKEAWAQSDNLKSFKATLEEHGYYLAQGDRRGVVAVDLQGEVFSVARWAGVKAKDAAQKLKGFESLRSVEATKADLKKQMTQRLRGFLAEDRKARDAQLKPLLDEQKKMVTAHRQERERLAKGQAERWQQENRQRAARLRTGLGKVMDILSGRLFRVRRENDREAYRGYLRDRDQREALFSAQMKDRQALQLRVDATKRQHREDRMRTARQIASALNFKSGNTDRGRARESKSNNRGMGLGKSR